MYCQKKCEVDSIKVINTNSLFMNVEVYYMLSSERVLRCFADCFEVKTKNIGFKIYNNRPSKNTLHIANKFGCAVHDFPMPNKIEPTLSSDFRKEICRNSTADWIIFRDYHEESAVNEVAQKINTYPNSVRDNDNLLNTNYEFITIELVSDIEKIVRGVRTGNISVNLVCLNGDVAA
jgi:hypothetical protein